MGQDDLPSLSDIPSSVNQAARPSGEQTPLEHGEIIRERRRLISAGKFGPASMGGVFNPGSLLIDSRIHLLCRAEAKAFNCYGRLFDSRATPVLCSLHPDLSLASHRALSYEDDETARPEDWRLFRHLGCIYTNHSVCLGDNRNHHTRVAISQIDLAEHRLLDRIVLEPPFSPRKYEKNWAVFSQGERLSCLYSVDPYVILEVDLQRGETRTILVIDDPKPIIGLRRWSRGLLSNSTNPVVWDADHFVTFVHYSFRDSGRYRKNCLNLQFGMLIDRKSLVPVSVIPQPLLAGGSESGHFSGVHYTMSLIVDDDVLYAFFGEGDMHAGVVVFDKAALGAEFHRHHRSIYGRRHS